MEELKEKPNYYAIIPANVRYDSDLSPNAKLLYGEITSLCNDKGYCWASNQYFMDLYSISDRTIRNLLKQLSDKEYIKINLIENKYRRIYIQFTNPEKNFRVGGKKFPGNPEKNFLHNNKNNIKNEYMNEINEILNYNWLDN